MLAPAELYEVPCELCGSASRATVRTMPPYTLHACAACGHVYLSPRPVAAAVERMERSRLPAAVPEIEALGRRLASLHRTAIEHLRSRGVGPGAQVIELGAGFGFFLSALRAAGFAPRGVEPSAAGCRFAEQWLGLRPECAALESWEVTTEASDAVVAFEVIDRVADPGAFLARARRALKPGGLFLLHWLGARRRRPGPPERLREFSDRAIARLLVAHGFEGVESRAGSAIVAAAERLLGGRLALPCGDRLTVARRRG